MYYYDLFSFILTHFLSRNKTYRKVDKMIISDHWVVLYDVLVIKNVNINSVILDTISKWPGIFDRNPANMEDAKKHFPEVLKNLIHIESFRKSTGIPSNDEYFFKKIKLQPLSEYISEQRNSQINKIINEE